KCPQCGENKLDSTGTCVACGHVTGKGAGELITKQGKVLSKANMDKLKAAKQAIEEVLSAADESALAEGVESAMKDAGVLATKGVALDTKEISHVPKGSFEYMQHKLQRTAASYLRGKGVEGIGEYDYCHLYATFADRAIVCH